MRLRTSPLAAVVVGQSTWKENATISNVRSSRAKSDSKIDLVLLASEGKARKSFLFSRLSNRLKMINKLQHRMGSSALVAHLVRAKSGLEKTATADDECGILIAS